MQILYGNDGNNYRTLARTADVDDMIEKSVLEAYLSYRFVENERNYSGIANQPVAITYVTTNLEGLLRTEQVLLCKNARMSNFSTPSSYAHFMLQDPEKEGYGEGFFRYLRYSFIRDVDAAGFTDSSLASYSPQVGEDLKREGIQEDILKSVVGYILAKDRSSSPVKIILDRNGDAYNARSLEVIEAIYRYLPYDLRKKYGFCTYSVPGQALAARVKIVLLDPDSVANRGTEYLDLANPALSGMFRQLNEDTRNYVDYLFSLTQEEREEYFYQTYSSMNGKALTAADYISLFKSVSRWNQEPVEKIFGEWLEFAAHNQRSKSPVVGIFKGIAAKRLDNETFHAYMEACLRQLEGTRATGWDDTMQRMLLFADMIEPLVLPEDVFLDWQTDYILAPLHKEYQEYDLIRAIEKEMTLLEKARVDSVKFQSVRTAMLSAMEQDIEEEQSLIDGKIQEEKDMIFHELSEDRVEYIRELSKTTSQIMDILRYKEETMPALADAWERTYRALLERVEQFREQEVYQEYRRQLELAPSGLDRDIRLELERMLATRSEWLREYEGLLSFQIGRDFAREAERQITTLVLESKKCGKSNPTIEILSHKQTKSRECQMELKEFRKFLTFLRRPDENSYYSCEDVLVKNKWLVDDLIRTENLQLWHIPFLREVSDSVEYTAQLFESALNYMDTSSMNMEDYCEDLAASLDRDTRQRLVEIWKRSKTGTDAWEEFVEEFELCCKKRKKNSGTKNKISVSGMQNGRMDRYDPAEPLMNLPFVVGIVAAVVICAVIAVVNLLVLSTRMTLLFTVIIYVIDFLLLVDLIAFAFFFSHE